MRRPSRQAPKENPLFRTGVYVHENMPELSWKYGYLYVSLLSVFVVVLLAIIGNGKSGFNALVHDS